MGVLVEAISVIVRRSSIETKMQGGWAAFLAMVPNATECHDEDIARVGFMVPPDVEAFVSTLEARGLVFRREGRAQDIAVVDQLRGPVIEAPWLQVGRVPHKGKHLVVASLIGSPLSEAAAPFGWRFEGSLSERPGFVPKGQEGDRWKFLRFEKGTEVYLDLVSGEEVYVGRPVVEGETPAAISTRLNKLCQEALQLEAQGAKNIALKEKEEARQVFKRLNELLEQATGISESAPGSGMAFAHFSRGLVLRILKRHKAAEESFRTANRIQPGVPHTLRELVKCLLEQGKHGEALPFSREDVERDSLSPAAWGNFAMCLIQCGQKNEARKAIDHAIELDPQDPLNRYIRDNFDSYFQGG